MRLFYYCILLFSLVTLGGCINDADPVDDPSGDPSAVSYTHLTLPTTERV